VEDCCFSSGYFSLYVRVELLKADCLVVVATYSMDDVQELSFRISVVQLVVDFLHVFEVDFSLSLVVNEIKCVFAAFFGEGVALNKC